MVTPKYPIVCEGQREPHLKFGCINYPMHPLVEEDFRSMVIRLAESIMKEFAQNRIVEVFDDDTVMLEEDPERKDAGIL